MIGMYGLPLDYLDTFTQVVNDTTREQVIDAFKRRVNLDRLLTVIVGGEGDVIKDVAKSDGADSSDKKESTN